MTAGINQQDDAIHGPNRGNPGAGRLGRRSAPDSRDLRYRMPSVRFAGPSLQRKLWRPGSVLDQGPTSSCVGHAWWGLLAAGPMMQQLLNVGPHRIYHDAQRIDEWPGEDYDGTSVRAGAKVLQQLGLVSGYQWAYTADEVLFNLLARGPVVLGTWWFPEMDRPNEDGAVHLEHAWAALGGHSYLCYGYDPRPVRGNDNPGDQGFTPRSCERGWFRCQNSWGKRWGDGGRFWISWDDLEFLLSGPGQDGEACSAVEVRAAKDQEGES